MPVLGCRSSSVRVSRVGLPPKFPLIVQRQAVRYFRVCQHVLVWFQHSYCKYRQRGKNLRTVWTCKHLLNGTQAIVLTRVSCWSAGPMGVRRIFPEGGNVKKLLILFRLLTMQSKWTFTKRFTLPTTLVGAGWTSILNVLSEMFSTFRLSEMIFLFINYPHIYFFEHFLRISHNLRIINDQNKRWKNQKVRHSRKTFSSNEK